LRHGRCPYCPTGSNNPLFLRVSRSTVLRVLSVSSYRNVPSATAPHPETLRDCFTRCYYYNTVISIIIIQSSAFTCVSSMLPYTNALPVAAVDIGAHTV
jgi:hypothetical protein